LAAPPVGLFIGIALAASAIHAAAAQECMSFCRQSPGEEGPESCAARCSPGGDLDVTRPWTLPAVHYGAIAIDPKSGASGSAYNTTSAAEAKQQAMSFCARYGNDCEVVISFFNTCAAVAAAVGNETYTVATNDKRGIAENKARNACIQKNGNCRSETSICAGP